MKMKIKLGALAPNLLCSTTRPANRAKCMIYLKAFFFLAVYLCAVPLPAQKDAPTALATITFSNGDSTTVRTKQERFLPIGLLPGETVNIQLQLPPEFVKTTVAIQALDGGLLTGDVADDGTAAIEFQAGVQLGLYRVLLYAQGRSTLLQFSVSDSKKP